MSIYESALMNIFYSKAPINSSLSSSIEYKNDILNNLSSSEGMTSSSDVLNNVSISIGNEHATIYPNFNGSSTIEISGGDSIVGFKDALGNEVFKQNGEIIGTLMNKNGEYYFKNKEGQNFTIQHDNSGYVATFEPNYEKHIDDNLDQIDVIDVQSDPNNLTDIFDILDLL